MLAGDVILILQAILSRQDWRQTLSTGKTGPEGGNEFPCSHRMNHSVGHQDLSTSKFFSNPVKALAPADLTSLIKNGHEYFNKRCNPSCSGHNKGTESGKEALPLSYVPYCMCLTAGKHVLISYLSADCTVLLHSCC